MKKIVIVGASSGIGYEVARIFVQKGWKVGVAARRTERLEPLCSSYPGQVEIEKIDVTRDDAPEGLRKLLARMGGMDIYLHVSGIGHQNRALDPEVELRTMQTNVVGFTRMVDEAFNWFKKERSGRGHIAIVSSIAGTKGLGTAPSYSASKRLQNTYIEALEQLSHLEHLSIRFTDLRPGFVRTGLLDTRQSYPLLMEVEGVAQAIVGAILSEKRVKVIDWRFGLLTSLWHLIPRWIWVRLPISTRMKKESAGEL